MAGYDKLVTWTQPTQPSDVHILSESDTGIWELIKNKYKLQNVL
jgi:hypothetical protein